MKTNGSHLFGVLVVWVAVALVADGGARADFYFGKPQNLGPVINTASGDGSNCTSADDLELYFSSDRPGGLGGWDLYVSTRQSVNDPWGPPVNLGAPVNSSYNELYPSLSSDGLTLYFSDWFTGTPRPGGIGGEDIWMTTRASRNDPWTTPINVGAPINSNDYDINPTISGDGLILIFCSNRAGGIGGADLWMSTRATVQDRWASPVNLGPDVNSDTHDLECGLSPDGLALFLLSKRGGGFGSYDLWMTTRKSRQDPWGPAVNLGAIVNSAAMEGAPGVSSDMRTLYFNSDCPGGFGGYDEYAAPIIPIVDFNGDGKVDIKDLVRLIESWGTDDPVVDIGPAPWGDSRVDQKDLEVLMSYWGQEMLPASLIAYWRLDEAAGATAGDSAGTNPGVLAGNPVWQPAGGKVKGALQLDGIDDYVSTPFLVNPAKGAFSVFAWVKGGTPGQVLLSQVSGANWLRATPTSGKLQTELNEPGRNAAKHLSSPVVITDGNWHRVGLVWDRVNRILYVDDVEVARGTLAGLPDSLNGLYLGAGSTLAPGTFWQGLLDDVRIYNRAVKP